MAWPSGKAEDCKSFTPSSNLGAACIVLKSGCRRQPLLGLTSSILAGLKTPFFSTQGLRVWTSSNRPILKVGRKLFTYQKLLGGRGLSQANFPPIAFPNQNQIFPKRILAYLNFHFLVIIDKKLFNKKRIWYSGYYLSLPNWRDGFDSHYPLDYIFLSE